MSIYQRNPDALPDSDFEPGALHHLVLGNTGRTLDPRRTPVSIVEMKPALGAFVARVEDFEDRGALWEEDFEDISNYQFRVGEARASAEDVGSFEAAIRKFDKPLRVPRDPVASRSTGESLARGREIAKGWFEANSRFFKANTRFPDPSTRKGDPKLYDDLKRFMNDRGVWDLEEAFARQFVSNPYSGELVKGHRIVMAELGLVDFEGKVIRDPDLFAGAWSRDRRAEHILARLAFVHAMFTTAGSSSFTFYRGLSTETVIEAYPQRTFVSASFNFEVAESHFTSAGESSTGILIRQWVPVERIFMTYLETASMNEQFLEAEAALLYEENNLAF